MADRLGLVGTLTEPPTMQLSEPAPSPAPAPPAANNMVERPGTEKDLNFKVSVDFHKQFKAAAVLSGKSMKDVLEEAFALWAKAHQK